MKRPITLNVNGDTYPVQVEPRERLLDVCTEDGLHGMLPSRAMCTDNAAMIAATAFYRLRDDGPTPLDAAADPNLRLRLAAT